MSSKPGIFLALAAVVCRTAPLSSVHGVSSSPLGFLLNLKHANQRRLRTSFHDRGRLFSAGQIPESVVETEDEPVPMPGTLSAPVPVTLLSGFLGSGKTTMLKHMLENKEGLKIGMVVNDVASVNIDSRLIREGKGDGSWMENTVELQNGCACCSASEDFIRAVADLVQMGEIRGQKWDHIVVEASGVAEPKVIRDLFQELEAMAESPGALINFARLDTMVTVVDASVFLKAYLSSDAAIDSPEFAFASEEEVAMGAQDIAAYRPIVDLLVEQIECADIIVVNKRDLMRPEQVKTLSEILRTLNPHAKQLVTSFGQVPPSTLLGAMEGRGISQYSSLEDLQDSIQYYRSVSPKAEEKKKDDHKHEHHHDDHSHGEKEKHAHEDTHKDHKHEHGEHGHSHEEHVHEHEHKHEHEHEHSHDHSHDHDHDHQSSAESRYGIVPWVYERRRPFHPGRFSAVMQHLPTVEHLALEKLLTSDGQGEVSASSLKEKGASQVKGEGVREALSGVVRSKGFIWLASSDTLCYQWSHAGRTFEMQLLGLWWDVRDREDWPEEFEEQILRDFEGEFGDRRQQLVFIGTSVADPKLRNELEDALDAALLTDAELEAYTQEREKGGQGGKGKAKRGRPRKSDGFQKLFPMPSLLAESIDRYQLEA